MSQEIDERIVRMQFDNEQFERGIRQSTQSMENFDKTLNMRKSMADPLQDISVNVEKLTNRFSILGEVIHNRVYNMVDGVVGKVERLVKSVSVDQISAGMEKYSKKTKAVATIQSALPDEDISVIYKALEKLNKYTDETSYDFTTMVENIGKFTSNGIGLEEAEAAMEGIASAVAKAGGGISEANRVMYNFSQSMGQGHVALMDWMSVENANAATKEFKQTIIDTAVELGVLKKSGDKITTKKGTKVDYKNFRGTLNEQWFTKDVLVATLAKYSDLTTDFGQAAYAAAQRARTFEDALNAVKDAVSTGWMTSFELMFGNVDEATELWTNFCNAIIETIAPISEFRNEVLKFWNENSGRKYVIEGLSGIASGFRDVITTIVDAIGAFIPGVEEGGDAFEFFGKKLVHWSVEIKRAGKQIKETLGIKTTETPLYKGLADEEKGLLYHKTGFLTGQAGDVVKTMANAQMQAAYAIGFTPETMADAIAARDSLLDSAGKMLGLTDTDQIFKMVDGLEKLKDLEKDIKQGSKGELVKTLQQQLVEMGYGDLLGEPGVDGIFGPRTEAALKKFQKDFGFEETGIFGAKSWDEMFGTHEVEGATEVTTEYSETLQKVQKIASGFWGIVRLAGKVVGDLFTIITGSSGTIIGNFNAILGSFSWIADIVVKITDWIYEKDIFGWIYQRFGWLIRFIASSKIMQFLTAKSPKYAFLGRISFAVTIIRGLISLINKIPGLGDKIKEKFTALNLNERFSKMGESVKTSFETVKKSFNNFTPVKFLRFMGDYKEFLEKPTAEARSNLKTTYGDDFASFETAYFTIQNYIDSIGDAISGFIDKIAGGIGKVTDFFTAIATFPKFVASMKEVNEQGLTGWDAIGKLDEEYGEQLPLLMKLYGWYEKIKEVGGTAFNWISEKATAAGNGLKALVRAPAFIKDADAYLSNPTGEGWDELLDKYQDQMPILSTIYYKYDEIRKWGRNTWETVKTKYEEYKTAIKDSSVYKWITSTFESARNAVTGWLDEIGVLDTITDIFDRISAAVRTAINWIKKFLGLGTDEEKAVDGLTQNMATMEQGQIVLLDQKTDAWVNDAEKVKNVQRHLEMLGYDVGSTGADGIYGSNTKAAYNQFVEDYQNGMYGDEDVDLEGDVTIWQEIGSVLSTIWETIQTAIEPYTEKIRNWLASVKEWFTPDEEGNGPLAKTVNSILSWLGLGGVAPEDLNFMMVVEAIVNKIVNFANWVIDTIVPAAGSIVTNGIWTVFWEFGKAFLGIVAVCLLITKGLDVLHDIALIKNKGAEQAETMLAQFASAILKIAISVGIIAVAIKLLSGLSTDELVRAGITVGAIGVFILVMAGAMADISKGMGTGGGSMQGLANAVLSFAIALGVVTGLILLVNIIPGSWLFSGMVKLGGIVLFTMGVMAAMEALSRINTGTNVDKAAKALLKMAAVFAILTGLILLLGLMPDGIYTQGATRIIQLGVFALGMMAFMELISKINKSGMGDMTALLAMAGAIVLLSVAVRIIGGMDTDDAVRGVLGVGALMVAMAFLMKSVSKISSSGASSIAKIFESILPVILIVAMFVGMMYAIKEIGMGSNDILGISAGFAAFCVGISVISVAIEGLSKLTPGAFFKGLGFLAGVIVALAAFVAAVAIVDTKTGAISKAFKQIGKIFGSFKAGMMEVTTDATVEANKKLANVEAVDEEHLNSLLSNAGIIDNFMHNLPDTSLWEGLASALGIGKSDVFANNIADFCAAMEDIQKSLGGEFTPGPEGADSVIKQRTDQAVAIATALSGLFSMLPPPEGAYRNAAGQWVQLSRVQNFANDIPVFVSAMNDLATILTTEGEYNTSVFSDDPKNSAEYQSLRSKVNSAVAIANVLAALFNEIKKVPSADKAKVYIPQLDAWKSVDAEIETFGNNLMYFVIAMNRFGDAVMGHLDDDGNNYEGGLDDFSENSPIRKKLDSAIAVGKTMSELFNKDLKIPDGTILAGVTNDFLWWGENYSNATYADLVIFGNNLALFVGAMNKVAEGFNTITDENGNVTGNGSTYLDTNFTQAVTNAATIATSISDIYTKLGEFNPDDVTMEIAGEDEHDGIKYSYYSTRFLQFMGDMMLFVSTMNDVAISANEVSNKSSFITRFNSDNIGKLSTAFTNAIKIATKLSDFEAGSFNDIDSGFLSEVLGGSTDNKMHAFAESMKIFINDVGGTIKGFADADTGFGDITKDDVASVERLSKVTTFMANAMKSINEAFPEIQEVLRDSGSQLALNTGVVQSANGKYKNAETIIDTALTTFSSIILAFSTDMAGISTKIIAITPITDADMEKVRGNVDKIVDFVNGVSQDGEVGAAAMSGVFPQFATLMDDIRAMDDAFKGLLDTSDVDLAKAYVEALNGFVTAMNNYNADNNGFTEVDFTISLQDPTSMASDWLASIEEAIDAGLESYHPTISAVVDFSTPSPSGGGVPVKVPAGRSSGLASDINNNSSSGVGDVNTTNNYSTSNAFNISNSVYVTGNTLDVNSDAWYSKVASKLMTYINRNNRNYGAAFGSMP